MSLVYVAYLDYTKIPNLKCHKAAGSKISKMSNSEHSSNLQFMVYSFLVICCLGIVILIYFQLGAIIRRYEWFYLCPYLWLWVVIAVNFFTSVKLVYITDSDKSHDRLTKLPCFVEGLLLSVVTMYMQLLSWQLVFVFCGFILNPLRAFLFCIVIIVAVVCVLVLLAVIMKIVVIIIFQTGEHNRKHLKRIMHPPTVFMDNEKIPYIDIILMISLIMLLIYAHAYSVFIFQVNINSSNITLEELTKSIIPKVLLIVIAWFLPKLFLKPEKTWLMWWKYTGKTNTENM